MVNYPDDPACRELVCRQEIARRATEAGMDFDFEDIIVSQDYLFKTVFLSRIKKPVYDGAGEQTGWEYQPLVYAVYGPESWQVRIVALCPWLVMVLMPDGTVKDGREDDGILDEFGRTGTHFWPPDDTDYARGGMAVK